MTVEEAYRVKSIIVCWLGGMKGPVQFNKRHDSRNSLFWRLHTDRIDSKKEPVERKGSLSLFFLPSSFLYRHVSTLIDCVRLGWSTYLCPQFCPFQPSPKLLIQTTNRASNTTLACNLLPGWRAGKNISFFTKLMSGNAVVACRSSQCGT